MSAGLFPLGATNPYTHSRRRRPGERAHQFGHDLHCPLTLRGTQVVAVLALDEAGSSSKAEALGE